MPIVASYRRAAALAFILVGLLTIVSLLNPPGLNFDPGIGMLEWRTLVEGGPVNSITDPDPADISKDRSRLITWWSPGQYVIPGALTTLGFRLGPALSITAGLCLLSCLLGWIRVFKHFAFSTQAAFIGVVLLSLFTYSTMSFRIYNGGDVLLQGIMPWLVMAGRLVPPAGAFRAVLLAVLAILMGFFAKLTGIPVAAAALAAGSMVYLARFRRITLGMVGGASGAVLAVGLLYAAWFSRGSTPASGTRWLLQLNKAFFVAADPWGAGISWMDTWDWLWTRNPSWVVWFLLPPAIFFSSVILWGLKNNLNGRREVNDLILFTLSFYVVFVFILEVLYMHSGAISLEERHFRPAGVLILICALGVADRLSGRSIVRAAVFGVSALMAVYCGFDFITRARASSPQDVDPYSRTHQFKVDPLALDFARGVFAREGRNAVFFLPFPDAASALPRGARFLTSSLDAESVSFLAARKYAGRARGGVYVLMRTRIAQSAKGKLLLREFTDYSPDGWSSRQFGNTTVFMQLAQSS